MRYGPIWFAGLFPTGHAVVITGISDRAISINDPWPPNVGARRQLSLPQFGQILQPLNAGPDNIVEAFKQLFMHSQPRLAPNLLYCEK